MLVQLGRRRLEIFFQNAIPSVKSLESLRIVVPQKKLSKWRRKSICVCVSVVFSLLSCRGLQILKENKDRKDAEFNELLKHRLSPSPPFFPPHFFLLA
jgi:hypothetical protein